MAYIVDLIGWSWSTDRQVAVSLVSSGLHALPLSLNSFYKSRAMHVSDKSRMQKAAAIREKEPQPQSVPAINPICNGKDGGAHIREEMWSDRAVTVAAKAMCLLDGPDWPNFTGGHLRLLASCLHMEPAHGTL